MSLDSDRKCWQSTMIDEHGTVLPCRNLADWEVMPLKGTGAGADLPKDTAVVYSCTQHISGAVLRTRDGCAAVEMLL